MATFTHRCGRVAPLTPRLFLRARALTTLTKAEGHFDVVIIGGGCAGSSIGSQLLSARPALSVAIVEPSETHYYQPGWDS